MENKEENNKEEKFSIDTENLKNQTAETAKKVKETVKNTSFKEETKATKGILKDMFKNPLEKIKEISNEDSGKYFKTTIFLIIIWTVITLLFAIISKMHIGYYRVFNNILNIIKMTLEPICGIIIYSLIVLVMNKNSKKHLTTIISTITVTKIPVIISSIASFLTFISSKIYIITSPFAQLCSVISIVLGYFGLKDLFNEEGNKNFIKKYALIQLIYYVAYIIIGLLGIYI